MSARFPFDPADVVRAVREGKTTLRAMANATLPRWRSDLRGTVLDLASGDGSEALRRLAPAADWVGVDLAHAPDVRADMTAPLPFAEDSADAAVCMWFLYMAPDPAAVLREIHRVLRPGGALILATPLVFAVNPEPRDLWRFTGEGLETLLESAGFSSWEVIGLGGRWTSSAYLLEPYLRPRRLMRPLAVKLCLWLDGLALSGRVARNPVGHVARAVA